MKEKKTRKMKVYVISGPSSRSPSFPILQTNRVGFDAVFDNHRSLLLFCQPSSASRHPRHPRPRAFRRKTKLRFSRAHPSNAHIGAALKLRYPPDRLGTAGRGDFYGDSPRRRLPRRQTLARRNRLRQGLARSKPADSAPDSPR